MIDKLDIVNSEEVEGGPLQMVQDKINELIEAFNTHYHTSMDSQYNTTFPKQHPPE